ncbi:MAG: hypothetical protein WC575_01500 [Patescibacteria group bacterium]
MLNQAESSSQETQPDSYNDTPYGPEEREKFKEIVRLAKEIKERLDWFYSNSTGKINDTKSCLHYKGDSQWASHKIHDLYLELSVMVGDRSSDYRLYKDKETNDILNQAHNFLGDYFYTHDEKGHWGEKVNREIDELKQKKQEKQTA